MLHKKKRGQYQKTKVFIKYFIPSSIAKSMILQYRQCIADGGSATKINHSYCFRKVYSFAAAFSGIANNIVVCNREQYMSINEKASAPVMGSRRFFRCILVTC